MAGENGKSTDDLLQLIGNQWWSVGESHKFNLGQYGVSDTELPTILQKLKDEGLDYELNKSSDGKSTLKVYKRSHSSKIKNVKVFIALLLALVSVLLATYAWIFLMVLVYPLLTVISKLLDNHWLSLEDFGNSYWSFLYGEDN